MMLSAKVTAIVQLDDGLSSPFSFITMPMPYRAMFEEDGYIYVAWDTNITSYIKSFEKRTLKKVIVDVHDVSSDCHEVEICDYIRFCESFNSSIDSYESVFVITFKPIIHLRNEEELWISEYICNEQGINMHEPEKNTPVTNGNISMPVISDIYYNDPYTTVKWYDGSRTTVRASDGDKFNKEYGLAMAIAKKYYECLGVSSSRKAFKQAVYSDAHDYTEAIAKRNARKEAAKNRDRKNDGHVSTSSEPSEG